MDSKQQHRHALRTPTAQQCCQEIFAFICDHEVSYPRWPYTNLVRSEWIKLKRLAKMGAGRSK